jgi:transposase-like protein
MKTYTIKYPLELRLKVVQAYREGKGGYKKLAKQFGVTRDMARFWILDRKRNKPLKDFILAKISSNGKPDKQESKELQDLRMQLAYYKSLSEILESECTDVKKKRAAGLFKELQMKDML